MSNNILAKYIFFIISYIYYHVLCVLMTLKIMFMFCSPLDRHQQLQRRVKMFEVPKNHWRAASSSWTSMWIQANRVGPNKTKFMHHYGYLVRDRLPISTREWKKKTNAPHISFVFDRDKTLIWKYVGTFHAPNRWL